MPAVSAIFLCYNCEAFVAEALRSALHQDYGGPIEIVVSDDASTDGTFAAVQEELARYRGRHQVKMMQRPSNSGSKSAHLNEVFPMCSGEILVSFDGDDISERSRVARIVERFGVDAGIFAVYSSYSLIDRLGRARGDGNVPHPPDNANSREWFAQIDAYAAGATLAIRRSVAEKFAPLDGDINEDIVLPFRASLLGEVAFIDAPLVKARRHAGSLTAGWERFTSIESYRARLEWGIERARRTVHSRLGDIDAAIALRPDRKDELDRLRSIVRDSLRKAELTASLMSPAFSVRIGTLLRLMRAGAYQDELLQHAGLAIAPGLYLRYKRRRLEVGREQTDSL